MRAELLSASECYRAHLTSELETRAFAPQILSILSPSHSERSSMRAEAAVEVLVVAGA
jgi:hypothetical protein